MPCGPHGPLRRVRRETALALRSLPRDLGKHPESGEPVTVTTGKFGPFLKCGKVARSVPAVSEWVYYNSNINNGWQGGPVGASGE